MESMNGTQKTAQEMAYEPGYSDGKKGIEP